MVIKDIDSLDDFNKCLSEACDKLVLVDFHAEWCGPCKMIAPEIKKLHDENPDKLVVIKVDVDEASDISEKYEIQAMPTFIFFKNGKEVEQFKGANKEKLRELTVKHL
uniref:Thioredoxin n=1 Tax=Ciona savignyi TaxID=51511 RepID=H2YAX3_CIOSA